MWPWIYCSIKDLLLAINIERRCSTTMSVRQCQYVSVSMSVSACQYVSLTLTLSLHHPWNSQHYSSCVPTAPPPTPSPLPQVLHQVSRCPVPACIIKVRQTRCITPTRTMDDTVATPGSKECGWGARGKQDSNKR